MVTDMLGESSAKQLDIISLSNDIVHCRIKSTALNIKENLMAQIKIIFSVHFIKSYYFKRVSYEYNNLLSG